MKKLKAFADDKIIDAQMMISVFDRVEIIVGKGENAGYQHFLLFPQCFQKAYFLGSLNAWIVSSRANSLPKKTRAITNHDHTPHQRIVIEQVLVIEWRML